LLLVPEIFVRVLRCEPTHSETATSLQPLPIKDDTPRSDCPALVPGLFVSEFDLTSGLLGQH
jgi:hypothetical protein